MVAWLGVSSGWHIRAQFQFLPELQTIGPPEYPSPSQGVRLSLGKGCLVPLCSPRLQLPPYRRGHSSPQEQSLSVWLLVLLLPV